MNERTAPRVRLLALTLIASAIHGLLLLNDGIYAEDRFWLHLLETNRFSAIDLFRDRGVIADPYFWWLVGRTLNPVFTFKLIVFICAVGAALLLYWIGRRSGLVSEKAAFFIAILAVSFPGFQTWPSLLTAMYIFYAFVYVAGAACALAAEDRDGMMRALFRVAAIVLFLVSFNLNSLLVLHYGFIVLLAYRAVTLRGERWLRFFARHLDYLIAPIVYRVSQKMFFPARRQFANQNELQIAWAPISSNSRAFIVRIYDDLSAAGRFLLLHPRILIAALLIALLISRRRRDVDVDHGEARFLFFAGAMLMVLAIFPYAIVSKSPNELVLTTRHEILLGLPVAMVIAAAIIHFIRSSRGREFAFVMACIAFSALTMSHYVAWEAAWVRQRAATAALSSAPLVTQEGGTIRVCDDFVERPDIRFLIWPDIFHDATHDSHITVSTTNDRMAANVVVSAGALQLDDLALVRRYEYLRFTQPSALPSFLRSIIRIEFMRTTDAPSAREPKHEAARAIT